MHLASSSAATLSRASSLLGSRLVSSSRMASASRTPLVAMAREGGTLSKRDLYQRVSHRLNLDQKVVEAVLNAVLDDVVQGVAEGHKVTITGFGTFEPRARAARKGRNPQTGEELQISATTVPGFSAGKSFKDKVKAASH